MASGFETYNDQGNALITNSGMISWYCCRTGSGTTVARSGVGNTTSSKAVVPVNGLSVPMVAIRMHDGNFGVARAANIWSTGEYQYASNAPVGAGFNYYIFDYSPRLPRINSGMEATNDAGEVTFSSAYHPFRVVADINGGATHQPGKELAICGPSFSGYARPDGQITYYYSYPNGEIIPVGEEVNGYAAYSYQNDCKLVGGRVPAGDYAEGFAISYDDVRFGPSPGQAIITYWTISAPVLAVDVTGIPVPGNFF